MKFQLFGLLFAVVLFVGCGKTAPTAYSPIDVKAKTYAEALKSADKTCRVDEDCAVVSRGCCLCNGKEAVNKDAALALRSRWTKECAKSVCTLQMCYVEINVSCQQGVCVGTPKPKKGYATL